MLFLMMKNSEEHKDGIKKRKYIKEAEELISKHHQSLIEEFEK